MATEELRRAHLNLVDSSRQFFELDPGAAIEAEPGWLFGAGSATHPVISNAAFRRDDGVDASEFISRAREFFAARGRGFSIWLRVDQAEDEDLAAAAGEAGFQAVYEMPEMVLRGALEPVPLPTGVELRQLSDESEAPDFWAVAKDAYATNGFPPEVFAGYTDHAGLLAENVAAFIAYRDDEPASTAMTIVGDGVAGVYWVGSRERARGLGLGCAVTVAATNAGLELGGKLASLQASPMGKPIYARLGYETVYDYRLLMSPQP
ncbi:MAG TPA: GNAT family N-acetyltransferase [Solirubrobacterales bacterium]|nr:GNAT family N-acetyltransferase [Solirubrobacterales bacterium]